MKNLLHLLGDPFNLVRHIYLYPQSRKVPLSPKVPYFKDKSSLSAATQLLRAPWRENPSGGKIMFICGSFIPITHYCTLHTWAQLSWTGFVLYCTSGNSQCSAMFPDTALTGPSKWKHCFGLSPHSRQYLWYWFVVAYTVPKSLEILRQV